MGPAIGGAIGLGLGAVKHHQDVVQYNRDKELSSQMERYSPWTGVHGQMPKAPGSVLDGMLQGGVQGAMMGSNFGGGSGAANAAGGSGAADASMVGGSPGGYNLTGESGGIAGGSNPFQLQQSAWQQPPTYYSGR